MKKFNEKSLAILQKGNLQTLNQRDQKDIKGGGLASSPLGLLKNGFFDIFTE